MDIKKEVEDETLDYSIVKEEYCITEDASVSVKEIGNVLFIQEKVKNEFTGFTEIKETSNKSSSPVANTLPPAADKCFKCAHCNKTYRFLKFLEKHLQTHRKDVSFPCSICKTPFKSDYSLTLHMVIHTKKRHTCKICGKKFMSRPNMKRHIKQIHESNKEFVNKPRTIECPVPNCFQKFSYPHYLKKHMIVHSAETPFECPKCPRKFKTKHVLVCHMRLHEEGTVLLTCAICNKTFQWKKDIRKHMLEHTVRKRNVTCLYCSQSISKEYLETHMEKQHKGLPVIEEREKHKTTRPPRSGGHMQCPQCDKSYRTRISLYQHIVRVHKEKRSSNCPICKNTFKTVTYLRQHMKLHGDVKEQKEPLKCPKCDMSCRTQTELNRHVKVHNRVSFPCSICQMAFNTANILKHHMKIHGVKSFKCQQCDRLYGSAGGLNFHMQLKHGRKKQREMHFVCKQCGKQFWKRFRYTNHMKVHEVYTIECPDPNCTKKFKYQHNLDKHMVIHSADKPFECSKCCRKFKTPLVLYNHMRLHEKGLSTMTCDLCKSPFWSKLTLQDHMQEHIIARKKATKRQDPH